MLEAKAFLIPPAQLGDYFPLKCTLNTAQIAQRRTFYLTLPLCFGAVNAPYIVPLSSGASSSIYSSSLPLAKAITGENVIITAIPRMIAIRKILLMENSAAKTRKQSISDCVRLTPDIRLSPPTILHSTILLTHSHRISSFLLPCPCFITNSSSSNFHNSDFYLSSARQQTCSGRQGVVAKEGQPRNISLRTTILWPLRLRRRRILSYAAPRDMKTSASPP